MSSMGTSHNFNPALYVEKNELYQIGPGFWNIRTSFRVFAKMVDVGTHMSIIQLKNGNFLILDTIELNRRLVADIDRLTNKGKRIEAVIATHPFHTLAFQAF